VSARRSREPTPAAATPSAARHRRRLSAVRRGRRRGRGGGLPPSSHFRKRVCLAGRGRRRRGAPSSPPTASLPGCASRSSRARARRAAAGPACGRGVAVSNGGCLMKLRCRPRAPSGKKQPPRRAAGVAAAGRRRRVPPWRAEGRRTPAAQGIGTHARRSREKAGNRGRIWLQFSCRYERRARGTHARTRLRSTAYRESPSPLAAAL